MTHGQDPGWHGNSDGFCLPLHQGSVASCTRAGQMGAVPSLPPLLPTFCLRHWVILAYDSEVLLATALQIYPAFSLSSD